MEEDEIFCKNLYKRVLFYSFVVNIVVFLLKINNIIITREFLLFEAGLLLGNIIVYFWIKSIHKTIINCFNNVECDINKYIKKQYIKRMLLIAIILIILIYFSINILIGTLVGLAGLKISAYLQINKFNNYLKKTMEY